MHIIETFGEYLFEIIETLIIGLVFAPN